MRDDAGGEPAEDDQQAIRYWFPKALAKFYIPLPDPAPIRDGYTYIWTVPIWPWDIEVIEANGAVEVGDSWLEAIAEQATALVRVDQQNAGPSPGVASRMQPRMAPDRPHAGLSAFGCIVRLWMGTTKGVPFPGLKYMADTLRRSEALAEGVTRIDPDEVTSHLVQEVDYSVAEVVVDYDADIDEEDAATKAINVAMQAIRHLQSGIYVIRRYPFRAATEELCPPWVPFLVGEVTAENTSGDYPVKEWVKHGFMLRLNPWDFGRPTMFSEAEYADLDSSLFSGMMGGPFISSLELRREATVALERSGDYRASVIWLAAAAESVFDELLRHLMWEEGQLPERCTEEFETLSVAARVKARFGKRLGGTWDLETPSPVTDWKVKVADVRNKVVHDQYRPTYAEAKDAVATADALVSYIGDLLVSKLKWYFRTAIKLVGHEGLERRGVYDDFKTCADACYQLDWSSTYARWRRAHELVLGPPRTPSLERSVLYLVYGRRNKGYWVASDPQTDMAVQVLIDESTLRPPSIPGIMHFLDGPQEPNDERAASMRFEVPPEVDKLIGKWREQYHLLPLYGVRVGGADIADREFIWRPKQANPPESDSPS